MASPQQSGYQCQFVDSVEDYECPLCLHVTREPFLTSCCGQHFCQVCISRILTENKPCPLCREISFTIFLDSEQKREILDLKVYCQKKAEGCQWVGDLGEIEQHLGDNCQFITADCPNNCGLAMQRRLLEVHVYKCPKRPHNCLYCDTKGTYQEIQGNHLPVCHKYPVSCPNQCGVSSLERDQLEDHLRECPLQLVECELREMGCEEMVKRKDLVKHIDEGTQKHLTLMASKFLKTQAKLYKRIAKLEKENDNLKKEIVKNQSDLEQIKQDLYTRATQIHANFTSLSKKSKGSRWENGVVLQTFPSNCKIKVNLYFARHFNYLEIQLTHVPSDVDCNLQWPKKFAMTVRLVNQAGDHDHYQVTKDVELSRGHYNSDINISYSTIESPPQSVQYISDNHITLQIFVTEK